MKSRYCLHCFAIFVLGLLPLVAAAQNDDQLSFVEGRYFEVVGTDHRSVSFANRLGEHVVELCMTYLQAGSHDFPQRIFVALRPDDRVEFDGEYQIQMGARGQVSLNFRWDASLSFEAMCQAFTEAYIVRYANFNYGTGASDQLRFWAVSALGSECYLNLRPAQQVQYRQAAREAGLLQLSSLLTVNWHSSRDSELSPRQGYWVLHALRQRGIGRADVGAFLDQAIAGRDVSAALERAVEPTDAEQQTITLAAWWQQQMVAYLSENDEYYENMEVSRAWLEELANFDAYRTSGAELDSLKNLWSQRNDAALRTVLSARRDIIALRLERVNPAYFNVAQSLGALYETTLQSEHRFKFIHAFTAYLSDWEDTKRLHRTTDDLLSAPSGG